MRPFDRFDLCKALAFATAAAAFVPAARADEPAYRFEAPVNVQRSAPFVELALPATAYARSRRQADDGGGVRDLRIVDSRDERVPFAWLAPRAGEARAIESLRDAVLYPLPARPAADGSWRSPIDIVVEGERINVRRLASRGASTGTSTDGNARSGGWLIDLGERKRGDPAPQSLRMQWTGPEEFSAGFRFETSDDLRSWRSGGAGQLLALSATSGPLTQPTVMLPANAGRFVRLVWADAAAAPALSGAKVIAATQSSVALDAPTELVFSTSPAPADKTAPDDVAQRALYYDLGGTLPLVQIDLRLAPGTRVAPVRLQGRTRDTEPWHELASSVFYRLERDTELSTSPPLALHTSLRYLRVLPDLRAAALDPSQTQLVVLAQLASLVFASQGQAPYTLWAGAEKAAPAALPVATLVPALDDERARFGRATLGDWREAADVARAADRQKQLAALRPWLLWAVLLAGVAGLAFMVWRLTRPPQPSA